MENMSMDTKTEILELTTEIVSSFVANNAVASSSLSDLIRSVHDTIIDLSDEKIDDCTRPKPAVAVSKSITDDYIICLEDGRKLKMLKRSLRSRYDLSPEQYRARWALPTDYPMVAPNYAKRRSAFAKEIGLGRKKTESSDSK